MPSQSDLVIAYVSTTSRPAYLNEAEPDSVEVLFVLLLFHLRTTHFYIFLKIIAFDKHGCHIYDINSQQKEKGSE